MYVCVLSFINYHSVHSRSAKKRDENDDDEEEKIQVLQTLEYAVTTDKFRPADCQLSFDPVARLHYPDAYNALLDPLHPRFVLERCGSIEDRNIRLRMRIRALDCFSNKAISRIRDNDAAAFVLSSLPFPLLIC